LSPLPGSDLLMENDMTANVIWMVFDGALRAAQLLPLALTLAAAPGLGAPAAAQMPRLTPLAAALQAVPTPVPGDSEPVLMVDVAQGTPLQLAARHIAIEVRGDVALVHTILTYRNTGSLPVQALYSVPLPATLTGPQDEVVVLPDDAAQGEGGCGDASFDLPDGLLAELIETGDALARVEHGSVLLAAGDEATFTLTRPVPLAGQTQRRTLVLPLGEASAHGYVPRFSAEVLVHAEQPITALVSRSHAGAIVHGLGNGTASLQIPDGRLHRSRQLAIEFELGAPAQRHEPDEHDGGRRALLATWGGEVRGATAQLPAGLR
jgi:hypothetical protein